MQFHCIVLFCLAFGANNTRFYISEDVYGWIAIFVVPVNSAVNPVLHTFSTPGYLAGAQISGQAQIPNGILTSHIN